jgi:hypothetical protein
VGLFKVMGVPQNLPKSSKMGYIVSMGKPMLWGTHILGHLQHGIFILGNLWKQQKQNRKMPCVLGVLGLYPESTSLDSLDSLSFRRQVQAQIHLAATLPTLGDMF